MFRPRLNEPARVLSSSNLYALRLLGPGRRVSAFGCLCPAGPIPFRIRTYEKTAHNSFRIRTSKTQDLKPFRIRTYEKTPGGGGLIVNQLSGHAFLFCSPQAQPREWDSQSWLSSFMRDGLCSTDRLATVTPSLRVSANSASLRYLFPLFAFQFSTFDCQPVPSQRTSTLPPLIYGIIPPHRGIPASARATSGRIPFGIQGGFSD